MSSPLITPNLSVEGQIVSDPTVPTTPGLHVPGAFPRSPLISNDIQQDTQSVMDAAIGTLQTAKGYVPKSVEDMKRLIENASDTVGGYLPQSVASYLPHQTTTDTSLSSHNMDSDSLDPSTNLVHHTTNSSLVSEESQYSFTGTGIPPGLLGDDQHISSQTPERTSTPTCQQHGPNPETMSTETGIAILPEERRQHHLPSHDDDPLFATKIDESLSTGGVGALPGGKEEVDVALLPDERKSPVESVNGASTDASTRTLREKAQDREYTLPASDSSSFTPFPISASHKDTTASLTHASNLITSNTTARTYPLISDGVKFTGVPLSEGFLKKIDDKSLSPAEASINERRKSKQGQSDITTSGHGVVTVTDLDPSSHASDETVRKKTGFMDRLKGEMKVISGKLSHKESKVEEGRRMMGKN